jgi:hypothetical protein
MLEPRGEERRQSWLQLHDEDLNDSHSSLVIIGLPKQWEYDERDKQKGCSQGLEMYIKL